MSGSTLPRLRPRHRTGIVWVSPSRGPWLESLGLHTASDFLALPGVVVSGHVGRNVSRVDLDGQEAYLKREHRIRLRDRWRSWRAGFGPASLSTREAAILVRLEGHDLPAPRPLAYGEFRGEGFLLVEAARPSRELCALSEVGDDLAALLGTSLARIHHAGIDQPDLFAKHVLVGAEPLALSFLDWQRAVVRSPVPWPNRARALAALRVTATPDLLPGPAWNRLLAAYLGEAARGGHKPPTLNEFGAAVDGFAVKLPGRRALRVRRRAAAPPAPQELVRINGETVCAVPAVAPALATPSAVAALYDPARDGERVSLPGGRSGVLRVRCYPVPFRRWWAAVRGRPWRSPELRAARLLFHLERHGIPGPKLLAYGQRVPVLCAADSFLLGEPLVAGPVGRADESAVHELLHRLHDAGCRLTSVGRRGEPFGVVDGTAVVRDIRGVRLVRRLTRAQVRRDRARLDAFFRGLQ